MFFKCIHILQKQSQTDMPGSSVNDTNTNIIACSHFYIWRMKATLICQSKHLPPGLCVVSWNFVLDVLATTNLSLTSIQDVCDLKSAEGLGVIYS